MPAFSYKAKQGPVKTVTGELDAESRSAAASKLDEMGYSPVWIKEKDEIVRGIKRLPGGGRLGKRDVTVFTRQLAGLIRSGVPILKAFSTLREQAEKSSMRKMLADMESIVRDGAMLSDAVAGYPGLFPELYVNMVRSGESAGVLDTVLFQLADAREAEEDMRRKVAAAMAYPLLILAVGIVTVFVLFAFFLPRVTGLFAGYNDLPLPTRMLIAMSGFISESWLWIVLAAAFAGALINRLSALDKGRMLLDNFKLGLPLIGKFVMQSDIAGFARTFSLLIRAGISIDRALVLSAGAMRNVALRSEVEDVATGAVRRGLPVSEGFRKIKGFPPMVCAMCAVGEESGRLDDSLSEIAAFYEKEVEQRAKLTASLIEPALILIVGGIVGFIVSAMLLPIFRLSAAM